MIQRHTRCRYQKPIRHDARACAVCQTIGRFMNDVLILFWNPTTSTNRLSPYAACSLKHNAITVALQAASNVDRILFGMFLTTSAG